MPAPFDPRLTEALDRLHLYGNNGWTRGFGQDQARRVLEQLRVDGLLDRDATTGAMLKELGEGDWLLAVGAGAAELLVEEVCPVFLPKGGRGSGDRRGGGSSGRGAGHGKARCGSIGVVESGRVLLEGRARSGCIGRRSGRREVGVGGSISRELRQRVVAPQLQRPVT